MLEPTDWKEIRRLADVMLEAPDPERDCLSCGESMHAPDVDSEEVPVCVTCAYRIAEGLSAMVLRSFGPSLDFGALLAAAVSAERQRTGESEAAVARRCGIARSNFSTLLRNPNARPASVRAVCRALGLRVALVPVGPDAAP